MNFYAHRINTIEDLKNVKNCYGIELDLRDYNGSIIVQHDPYKEGVLFEDYIKYLNNINLILNIKSERIENKIINILNDNNYKGTYFFLDSSFPMIYSLSKEGNKNIALRFSEFEGLDTLINMKGKVDWVWVDVFTKIPLTFEISKKIKDLGYKICLVSPELQGREYDIEKYGNEIIMNSLIIDAICCKYHNIEKWKKILL